MKACASIAAFVLITAGWYSVIVSSRGREYLVNLDVSDTKDARCSLPERSPPESLLDSTLVYLRDVQREKSVLLRLSEPRDISRSHKYVRCGTLETLGSFTAHKRTSNQRQQAVREAARSAWDAYEKYAWGYDELRPLSLDGKDTFAAGLGTTIVDSLSTLYVMGGLDGRYERARNWVATNLRFDRIGCVIVFETVIRILGGLVSIYHLSGDEMYIRKAEELGARLAVAFDTPHGFPWPRCYLNDTGKCEHHVTVGDSLYLAEVGTIQLEFRALAYHSTHLSICRLKSVVEKIIAELQTASSSSPRLRVPYNVLLPFALSHTSGKFSTNLVTLGAPADSYFEYLVKLWVQGGRAEEHYWNLIASIIDAIGDVAVYRSQAGDVIVRDIHVSTDGSLQFTNKMDHFACYIPGMIILSLDGLNATDTARRRRWETLAHDLTETCYKMYSRSQCGLSGEHIRLGSDDKWRVSGGYQLRPEALEALFYMYRHTKDEKYRRWAWEIFEKIELHCRTREGGYAALKNVRSRNPSQEDVMHSFLIAETFKYLFLIFGDDDDELPLSKWVFNTEAHPLLVIPGLGRGETGCDRVSCHRAEACSRNSAKCSDSSECPAYQGGRSNYDHKNINTVSCASTSSAECDNDCSRIFEELR